jgi:hypothetical protein
MPESSGPPKSASNIAGNAATPTNPLLTTTKAIDKISLPIIIQFMSVVAPYFLVFFFVFVSILESNLSGFVYLLGCFVVYGIIEMFKNTFPSKEPKNEICSVLEKFHGDHPSYITGIYFYTLVFLLIPMMLNNNFNLLLILTLLIIILVDFIIRINMLKCMPIRHAFLGLVIGVGVAVGWSFTIQQAGHPELLYSTYTSTKNSCSNNNNNFKCKLSASGDAKSYDVYL